METVEFALERFEEILCRLDDYEAEVKLCYEAIDKQQKTVAALLDALARERDGIRTKASAKPGILWLRTKKLGQEKPS